MTFQAADDDSPGATLQASDLRTSIQGLYQECTGENVYDKYACAGYIAATMDNMTIIGATDVGPTFGICPTTAITVGAARQVFINWAQKNPDKWTLLRYVGVVYALRETWPCGKSQAQ